MSWLFPAWEGNARADRPFLSGRSERFLVRTHARPHFAPSQGNRNGVSFPSTWAIRADAGLSPAVPEVIQKQLAHSLGSPSRHRIAAIQSGKPCSDLL